jgi:DNA polymerase elongation subunit (family B)
VNVETDKALGLDIETTGLDPEGHEIVAVGVTWRSDSRVFVGDERSILIALEQYIADLPEDSLLTTWNGEEFDLPFLKARFDALSLETTLTLTPRGTLGKYGKPRYSAVWGTTEHLDIAPLFEEAAAEAGVRWSLKPVARALLGVEPVEVDNRGESIAVMPADELTAYVLSDASVTLSLAEHLEEARQRPGGTLIRPS